ncbi:hypothetical protein [Asticcacaulis taihuensis]|uniref:hypothetical protein n=1 Tax=Asticcacaulis taihuensis TaxID=260084 RepID=UPI0026F3092B|nr:hypothetical protein [Asticcacaulis taihuensis]MCR6659709.1 hypothetical protein [Asticcacaulis sp.]
MIEHSASSASASISSGTALCIQSGSLRRGDGLRVDLAGDGRAKARIERFDMTGLYLSVEGQSVKCRPWRKGDMDLTRCRGTSSRFTVETVTASDVFA